jgi:translation initiation factor 4B
MSLADFHAAVPSPSESAGVGANESGGGNKSSQIVRLNWADEMDKYEDNTGPAPSDFVFDRSKLPTAAKATLGPDFDLEQVPKTKPFTAHISNVSFEADEEKLKVFFKDLKVLSVRLVSDERGRSRGYGYVEFEDRESLIGALTKVDTTFNNRAIKISLDEQKSGNDRQGGFGNRGHHQDSNQGPLKSDEAEWRRREPEPEEPSFSAPQSGQSYNKYQQNYNNNNNNSGYNSSNTGRYQNQNRFESKDQRGGDRGG